MAGYSHTPLLKKLGIKPGFTMYTHQAPPDYFSWLAPLPPGVQVLKSMSANVDFIHVFAKDRQVFEKEFVRAMKALKKNGLLWISWPKRSSGVSTDLDENHIRAFGLREGLVDVKVCAVDETWSALKFVFRLQDR